MHEERATGFGGSAPAQPRSMRVQRPAACGMRLLHASAAQHVHDRVVPLVAGVLEQVARSHPPPRLVRRHREADGPRPGEADRVGDRRFVVDRVGIDSREPLDYAQTRGRRAPDVAEPILRPIRKVAALDHKGVPVPSASRLTVPPRDAGPRAAVDRNDAAHMVHLVQDHHVGRRLEDLVVRVVAEPDLRQPVAEAPLPRVEVEVRVPGAGPVRPLVVARRGRVGDSAVRRVDDQRRAPTRLPGGTLVEPEGVVAEAAVGSVVDVPPAGARSAGRASRRSSWTSAAFSSAATSSSLRNSRPSYSDGRSSGVSVEPTQIPFRAGSRGFPQLDLAVFYCNVEALPPAPGVMCWFLPELRAWGTIALPLRPGSYRHQRYSQACPSRSPSRAVFKA